jgi:predicted MFS family arabinose efflux permease
LSPRWRCLSALTVARAAIGFQFQSLAAVGPPMVEGSASTRPSSAGSSLVPAARRRFRTAGRLLGRRFGDKRLVLVGLALMAIGGAGLALAGSFAAANVARFVSGVGAVILNVL